MTSELSDLRLPQPGERWRVVRSAAVEYRCPACDAPLDNRLLAHRGQVVTIVAAGDDATFGDPVMIHRARTCNAHLPVPWGWIWYSPPEGWRYALPYTLFEPVEE